MITGHNDKLTQSQTSDLFLINSLKHVVKIILKMKRSQQSLIIIVLLLINMANYKLQDYQEGQK